MAKHDATGEDLKAHAREAADEAQKAAEALREKGAEFVGTARERGHEYAERARDEARRIYREGGRRASEMATHAEEYYDEVSGMVRRHPAQALGIAAGIGFLLGLIIARR